MSKLSKMTRFVPGLYRPNTNPNIKGLLYAWSSEDDLIVQAAQNAKEQIFTKLARLQFLDALGSNVGVFRPTEFNLTDDLYRQLIPVLSFRPKQVLTTIKRVLDIFFGVGNPIVKVNEINANEIIIHIPSSVPSLRRDLRGSLHLHAYQGTVVSIDNIAKEMVIDLNDSTKSLKLDELALAIFGQGLNQAVIASNTVGNTSVTFQFFASEDLSIFNTSDNFNIVVPSYPGAFIPDPTRAFTLTSKRGILGQSIVAGAIIPTLTMTDASQIPDAVGRLSFNFGFGTEETLIKYFGRPNNSTLLLDPSYSFVNNHSIGEAVNVVVTPYIKPAINGNDFSVYLVGVTAARLLAQKIVRSIVAAGVVVRFIVVEPSCD